MTLAGVVVPVVATQYQGLLFRETDASTVRDRIDGAPLALSPKQIARRFTLVFPDDETMRISHEAIYQALFVRGRDALRRELTACLRTGRTSRTPRARVGLRGKNFVSSDIIISQRPAEADDGTVLGHREGDLILRLGSSAIGTLVERTTRFTMLLHLPAWMVMVPDQASRTARRWRGTVPRPYATRSRGPSPSCLRICAGRSLGIRGRDGAGCLPQDRCRRPSLLLRSEKPMPARQQREHQRGAATILSQGHRPRRP